VLRDERETCFVSVRAMSVQHFAAYDVERMVDEARAETAEFLAALAMQTAIAIQAVEPDTQGLALGHVWRKAHATKVPAPYVRAVLIAVAAGKRVLS